MVRVRFAPSPTGHLHVGVARTALFNWLYARSQGGKYILRIEDTDLERSTKESEETVLRDLQWMGLDWDEGPGLDNPGDLGPYRQSERKEIYSKHAMQLVEMGKAFYCFCDEETLKAKREKLIEEGKAPHYDGTCRDIGVENAQKMIAQGKPGAIRFKVAGVDKVIHDLVKGDVEFSGDMLGDFIVLRSNGLPVYNYCCAVDDHLMNITHVLRGDDHLSNTLRQVYIYEAFGWELPKFGHISMILAPDKSKLSKRHGATSVGEFKDQGFTSEAICNFLALLGWSDPEGREKMSIDEIIKAFSIDRLAKNPAVFDPTKLRWLNSQYLHELEPEALLESSKPYLDELHLGLPDLVKKMESIRERVEVLGDVPKWLDLYIDDRFEVSQEGIKALEIEGVSQLVEQMKEFIQNHCQDGFSVKALLGHIKGKVPLKGKSLFIPLRVILSGQTGGPDLGDIVSGLETASILKRVEAAGKHTK